MICLFGPGQVLTLLCRWSNILKPRHLPFWVSQKNPLISCLQHWRNDPNLTWPIGHSPPAPLGARQLLDRESLHFLGCSMKMPKNVMPLSVCGYVKGVRFCVFRVRGSLRGQGLSCLLMAYGTDLPKCHSRGWDLPTSAAFLARSASVPEDVEPTPCLSGRYSKSQSLSWRPPFQAQTRFRFARGNVGGQQFSGRRPRLLSCALCARLTLLPTLSNERAFSCN